MKLPDGDIGRYLLECVLFNSPLGPPLRGFKPANLQTVFSCALDIFFKKTSPPLIFSAQNPPFRHEKTRKNRAEHEFLAFSGIKIMHFAGSGRKKTQLEQLEQLQQLEQLEELRACGFLVK